MTGSVKDFWDGATMSDLCESLGVWTSGDPNLVVGDSRLTGYWTGELVYVTGNSFYY